jgi:hypothetical protein
MQEHSKNLPAGVVFLALGGRGASTWSDPDPAFLARFSTGHLPLKGASRAIPPGSGQLYVTDRETGTQGIVFRIESIQWKSNTEVEVVGGYTYAALAAAGYTYNVTLDGEKWNVESAVMQWQS